MGYRETLLPASCDAGKNPLTFGAPEDHEAEN
jgi:hypothetical protein